MQSLDNFLNILYSVATKLHAAERKLPDVPLNTIIGYIQSARKYRSDEYRRNVAMTKEEADRMVRSAVPVLINHFDEVDLKIRLIRLFVAAKNFNFKTAIKI